MSRIGKQIINIPEKTEVALADRVLSVKGPHGELSRTFNTNIVGITVADGTITFTPKEDTQFAKALWGTYASHVKNMVDGVNTPYEKKLILEGVGFRIEQKGEELHMALGFSHPVVKAIPKGLTVSVEKNQVAITGIDKELVGSFAADLRALKKPEPYKGKGFRYEGEIIKRKQGKKSA